MDNWKHRSTNMLCRSCMYFVAKEASLQRVELGRCRRHAPTMGGFPAVFQNDWCGDHKIDEEKLPEKAVREPSPVRTGHGGLGVD